MDAELLTPAEAARFLRISVGQLWTWKYRGGGPACIVFSKHCVRFLRADLEEFILTRRKRPKRKHNGKAIEEEEFHAEGTDHTDTAH